MTTKAYRTCPLCEATCGLELTLEGDRVKVIRGDRDNVFSGGFICPKGTTLGRLHDDPDRLRAPVLKREGAWETVAWPEAYAFIAERFEAVVGAHGRNSVGIYIGNPNAHQLDSALALRPFTRALGTRNVFSASTLDQMPKHVSCGYMFGHPGTIPVPDLDRTDYLLILGANPYESNGSLATAPDWPGRLEAIRRRGGRVVVVDPRRTRTAVHSDLHLPIRPGTDAVLLVAMINHLFTGGLVDLGHLTGEVAGLDAVREATAAITVERAAAVCGIDAGLIVRAADDLAGAERGCVYGRIGTHTVRFGTIAAWAVDVLNVLTGNLDRAGGAMFPKSAAAPARRSKRPFQTGRWLSRVRGLPEVLGELPAVTMADEILTPGDEQVRAMFVVAGNPVITSPDSDRLAEALDGLDLMVSVDPYLNATSRLADVILPPPSALERPHFDVAFTALSVRNYAMFSPAVFETEAPSEFDVLVTLTAIVSGLGPDVDVKQLAWASVEPRLARVASALGREVDEIRRELAVWDDPRLSILDLMLRTGAYGDGFGSNPGGLNLAVLAEEPHGVDLGPLESRLSEVITTESGKIELAPTPIIADIGHLSVEMDGFEPERLVLVGRRQVRTANSWLGNIEVLVKGKDECTLHVHPDDATRLGLVDGKPATVTSSTGKLVAPVEITDDIRSGVVSMPYGWGHDLDGVRLSVAGSVPGVNVNRIISTDQIDPLSGNAVLNGVPVTVTPG